MNILEKYLSNKETEGVELDKPTNQREFYTELTEGLEKTGPEATKAATGLKKYMDEFQEEPKYPGIAPGEPSENLAVAIRSQDIIPSEESKSTFENLFGQSLPGTGEKSQSEIDAYQQDLAYQYSDYQRGYPTNSQEELGITILGGKTKDNESPTSLYGSIMESMHDHEKFAADLGDRVNALPIWGPSKATAGILTQDKELYGQGLEESLKVGIGFKTFDSHTKGDLQKGLENLVGQDNIERLKTSLQPLKGIEEKIGGITKELCEPAGDVKKSFGKTAESLKDLVFGEKESFGEYAKNTKEFVENAQDTIKSVFKAPIKTVTAAVGLGIDAITGKKLGSTMDAMDALVGTDDKNLEDIKPYANDTWAPPKHKKNKEKKENEVAEELPQEETPKQKNKNSEEISDPKKDNATGKEKEEETPLQAFVKLLTSQVAYQKALKKGANPKEAGEAGIVAGEESKEQVKQIENAPKDKQSALIKGVGELAKGAGSKLLMAVPPPAGLALSLAFQLSTAIVGALSSANQEPDKNAEKDQKGGPMQGLGEAIPGGLGETTGASSGNKMVKGVKQAIKGTIAKGFPNGIASAIGEKVGETVGQAIKNDGKTSKEGFQEASALDRQI
jgi:hypothetical protein